MSRSRQLMQPSNINRGLGARGIPGTDELFLKPSSLWDPGTSDWSIAVWVRFESGSFGGVQEIVNTGCGSDGQDGFALYEYSDGNLRFKFQDSVQATLVETPGVVAELDEEAWYLIAVTCDRDGLATIYVNDVLEDTLDITTQQGSMGASFDAIGAYYTGALPLNGRMSRYGQFSDLLTAGELTELYSDGYGKAYDQLSSALQAKADHYYNLNEPRGDAVCAVTGQTSTATGTGVITSVTGPHP